MSNNRTILLVDDVQMFRELGSLFLARVGRVVTAESAEEAIEFTRKEKPDLIVTDLQMPGMDGDEVCRFVKSDPDLHETPVIILVGDDSPKEWGRAVRSGADDVLGKPLSRIGLNESVNRLLRSGEYTGLPRVEVNVPVQLKLGSRTQTGRMRNLSRGGLFIETDCRLRNQSEFALSFVLPESEEEISPTAQVVWQRQDSKEPSENGVGVRFVDISGDTIRTLEEYVFDRATEPGGHPQGANA